MAIIAKTIETDYPENAWTFTKASDGTIKLTRRTRGPAKEMAKLAQAFNPGAIVDLTGDDTMPFSGPFVQSEASLNWDGPGMATLDRVYTSLNNGGSFVLGEDKSEINEVLDFQTLEKPLTDAPFWRKSSEGSDTDPMAQAKAMKAVQAYIDAGDHEKGKAAVKEILNKEASPALLTMAAKRMAGIEGFYVGAPTLSRSETKTTKPTNVGQEIGKIISDPDINHVPVPGNMEWLGGGERVSWNGTSYTHERTWIGAEKWDTDLYERA